jgi:hypothetical protein
VVIVAKTGKLLHFPDKSSAKALRLYSQVVHVDKGISHSELDRQKVARKQTID